MFWLLVNAMHFIQTGDVLAYPRNSNHIVNRLIAIFSGGYTHLSFAVKTKNSTLECESNLGILRPDRVVIGGDPFPGVRCISNLTYSEVQDSVFSTAIHVYRAKPSLSRVQQVNIIDELSRMYGQPYDYTMQSETCYLLREILPTSFCLSDHRLICSEMIANLFRSANVSFAKTWTSSMQRMDTIVKHMTLTREIYIIPSETNKKYIRPFTPISVIARRQRKFQEELKHEEIVWSS